MPLFFIPVQTFPVEIVYTNGPETDREYLDASIIRVMQIHLSEPPGDISLFLTGQEEIDTACQILYQRSRGFSPDIPELLILPIYSALPSEVQSRVFEPAPPGARKVAIATDVAETSLAIPNISYIVDPGFLKQNTYDSRLGTYSLAVMPISRAQANQRSGCAGRVRPGKCYRLYPQSTFLAEMHSMSVPEIRRTSLASTILQLKAMGINDVLSFDFMDPPPAETIERAMASLRDLSAVDDEGLLTRLGRKMAHLPIEPQLAKTLIASVGHECSEDILSIAAMLSVPHAAKKDSDSDEQGAYKIVGKDVLVRIHPSSALFYRAPEWLVYHELTVTAGKAYCHDVTAVEPEWLVEVAPTP
ncbi:P-loop containing nucleoside triphosphate hydrolase protein [Pterulicium gracile]|uniref:RNA helicase n=1 Tax=Pterulicium gracile TaxID=1884261 RepID=A0A5C3QV64_9AGAR|nr:P-loop containing nucleoside triphosphate hydrolase protein [Pterula gracilis]